MRIIYILTSEIIADRFTKPLDRIVFKRFKDILRLVDNS